MSVSFDGCAIHHIPRTGGTSVRAILLDNKIDYELHYDSTATGLWDELIPGSGGERHHVPWIRPVPTLVFIRDPAEWYISLFAFRREKRKADWGWNSARPFDECRAPTFHRFTENVLREYPHGFATRLFMAYAKVSTHVGFLESLGEDLRAFALEATGRRLAIPDEKLNSSPREFDVRESDRLRLQELEALYYETTENNSWPCRTVR